MVSIASIASGKRLHNYRKSPCLMGKLTISMTIFNSKLLVYQRVAPFHWQWIDHKVPKVPGQGSGRDAQGTIQGLLPFRSVSDPVFILDVKHLGVDHSSANVQVVEGSKNRDPHPIS